MMSGISGCFGTKAQAPIDDLDQARRAVNDIIDSATTEAAPTEPSQETAPDLAALQLVAQYVRRLRLLTWAVLAIVVYLFLKEA